MKNRYRKQDKTKMDVEYRKIINLSFTDKQLACLYFMLPHGNRVKVEEFITTQGIMAKTAFSFNDICNLMDLNKKKVQHYWRKAYLLYMSLKPCGHLSEKMIRWGSNFKNNNRKLCFMMEDITWNFARSGKDDFTTDEQVQDAIIRLEKCLIKIYNELAIIEGHPALTPKEIHTLSRQDEILKGAQEAIQRLENV
uniref:Uncharacterized protein n=1 Tax=viral metagenome TaxID=1070528 RepID=A0A6C0JVJ1_9ZZZZ